MSMIGTARRRWLQADNAHRKGVNLIGQNHRPSDDFRSQDILMKKRILIVDDEPNIVISLEFLMMREGHEVRVARDGEAGLAAVRTHRPDLVVLDVMMPKLDGFAVLEAVRADPTIAETRILLLTAMGGEVERSKGLALGADAYMTKPFSIRELVEKVNELLRTASESVLDADV